MKGMWNAQDEKKERITHEQRDHKLIGEACKDLPCKKTCEHPTAFCVIRSYLSTMRKQGRSMLAALAAVFHRAPLPVAWSPG
ncbi:hypothetical protein KSF_002730 [Reticulibacter mediterranei]|uniref:Uncharacterized protein n=1 Tax=Reticulibacter mediterranei TaxID=2778369 RepID=A0A8J3IGB7_9CHLR|nr:hypothetical protein KSF_002730 [Reticulibacter mediterranei]